MLYLHKAVSICKWWCVYFCKCNHISKYSQHTSEVAWSWACIHVCISLLLNVRVCSRSAITQACARTIHWGGLGAGSATVYVYKLLGMHAQAQSHTHVHAPCISEGVELGVADDRVFERRNSKQGNGTVGHCKCRICACYTRNIRVLVFSYVTCTGIYTFLKFFLCTLLSVHIYIYVCMYVCMYTYLQFLYLRFQWPDTVPDYT
jgi:hypothetical protein